MIDMKPTIIAKSDQLNADDLVAGPITVTITEVRTGSGDDQPISMFYEGCNGKPFKPCKTMRRLLVGVWGDDGAKYVGQSMTLYREPDVKWAGQPVGGIRISHMTGLNEAKTLTLQETKGKKKPVTVQPLKVQEQSTNGSAEQQEVFPITDADYQGWQDKMDAADDLAALKVVGGAIGEVSSRYDQPSKDKLNAYYKDRMKTLKEEMLPA